MSNERPNAQLLHGLPVQNKFPYGIDSGIFRQSLSPQNADLANQIVQQPTNVDAPNPQLLQGLPPYYKLQFGVDNPKDIPPLDHEKFMQTLTKNHSFITPERAKLIDEMLSEPVNFADVNFSQQTTQYTPTQNAMMNALNENLNSPADSGTPRQNVVTLPMLSPREYEAQSQIYAHKLDWKAAQEEIDALQKLNPQADEDKKKIQARIEALKAQQKNSADAAKVLRNAAGAMGWNITGMGADDSFDMATQLMAINQNRGMAELADMPSTAAQKWNVYADMVRNGESPYIARNVAEMFHDRFRENNIQKLTEGIRAYGTNGDGSLNEFGQMLAGKLYNENPYMYGNVVNGFASPKDIFGTNAQLANTRLAQEGANQRAFLNNQNAANIAVMREQGLNNRTQYVQGQQNARHAQDVQIKIAEIENKSPIGQFRGYYDLGKQLYGDNEAAALQFAFDNFGNRNGRSNGNGGGSGNRGGSGNAKNEKPTGATGAMNAYKVILSDIENGNYDLAADTFSGILEKISKDPTAYYKDWNDETVAIDTQIRAALKEYFSASHEYEYEEGNEASEKRAEEQKAKDKAADKQRLFDRLRVVGTDISADEVKQARQFAEHTARDKRDRQK